MTPTEALTFIQNSIKLPVGLKPTVIGNCVYIGNAYGQVVLTGDLLLNEDTITLTLDKSLPSLQEAIKQTFEAKKAADELDAKLKAEYRRKLMSKKR